MDTRFLFSKTFHSNKGAGGEINYFEYRGKVKDRYKYLG